LNFEPGEKVWVRKLPQDGTKLDPLWIGPCEVLRYVPPESYVVALPDKEERIHMDRMKPYLPTLGGQAVPFHFYRPKSTPMGDGDVDNFVVEKVLKHKMVRGKLLWLVKWQGYGDEHNQWLPAENVVGHVQDDWLEYCKKNGLDVSITKLTKKK
jgi:hypothetical protein